MDLYEQFRSMNGFLQKLYLWPKGDDPDNVNYSFYLKLISFSALLGFPIIFTIFHTYHYRYVVNSSMMADLTVLLDAVTLVTIFLLFVSNLKEIVRQLNFYIPQIARLHSTRINFEKITRIIRYMIAIGTILVGLFLQWDTQNCEKRKAENNSLRPCGLFLPIYLPFEYNFFPLKQYILIHQGVTFVVIFIALIQIATLLLVSLVNVAEILTNLIHLVEDFDNDLNHNLEVTELLRRIVKIHQFVTSFIKDFDKQSRYINMVHFIFGSLIMATTIFDVIKTGNILSVVHGLMWSIGLTVVQLAGQLTINKGLEFERAVYNTSWYKLRKLEDRKCYLLLLHMSQKPVAFHAGPFAEVSSPMLLALFRATYSGTTMLINTARMH